MKHILLVILTLVFSIKFTLSQVNYNIENVFYYKQKVYSKYFTQAPRKFNGNLKNKKNKVKHVLFLKKDCTYLKICIHVKHNLAINNISKTEGDWTINNDTLILFNNPVVSVCDSSISDSITIKVCTSTPACCPFVSDCISAFYNNKKNKIHTNIKGELTLCKTNLDSISIYDKYFYYLPISISKDIIYNAKKINIQVEQESFAIKENYLFTLINPNIIYPIMESPNYDKNDYMPQKYSFKAYKKKNSKKYWSFYKKIMESDSNVSF